MKSTPMILLAIMLLASLAVAEEKPAQASWELSACCVEAAQAGKSCCGQEAEQLKAAYVEYQAVKTARAELHECCLAALDEAKGCCGKDAESLKAGFEEKVAAAKKASVKKAAKSDTCPAAKTGCSKPCAGSQQAGSKKKG